MNALLRNQTKLTKVNSKFGVFNKYSTIHNRSYQAMKYRLSERSCKSTSLVRLRTLEMPQCVPAINVSYHIDTIAMPEYLWCTTRDFHHSHRLYDTPSSKVEVTVQTMKEKQKEKVEEIIKSATATAAKGAGSTAEATTTPEHAVAKKSIQARIWAEVLHYYHGFKLLIIDINVCRRLLWRVLNGKTLTRRENKLLVRTTSDLFRLIPFSVFIIVPFMEFLLPVFIKFFPGLLPSTFQTAKQRENKLKRSLAVRLEMAKFLQKTLDEMSVQHKEHRSEDAKQFAEFFQKIKSPNDNVSAEEIIKFAKSFEDEITLDTLGREQLVALCRVLELNTMGTTNLLRFQLRVKLRSLSADDRVIHREGVNSLDLFELQLACKARGMRAYGLTANHLRAQLQEWIDLSLNEKVPPILLLLSRALHISDEVATPEKLKETIRVLPDALAAHTKAAIGEREGKIDNKTKIEVIKEEERLIKEEREEEREVEKAKKIAQAEAQAQVEKDKKEILLDKAPIISSTATAAATAAATPVEDKRISSKDVELLSDALQTLSSDKKTLTVEKGTIKEIKEELEEYKEDVEELHAVRNVVKEPVSESRAAKLLYKKVNSMIGHLDKVLAEIEKKQQEIDVKREGAQPSSPEEQALKRKKEDLVYIDELLGQTTDISRLKPIERVLSKIDQDKDGIITVEEILKVVDAMRRDNVKLDEKQIEELIVLLDKEQLLEAEERIEKAIARSMKEEKLIADKKAKMIAEGAAIREELRDKAPVIKDNTPELKDIAIDISVDDKAKQTKKAELNNKKPAEASILGACKNEKCTPKVELTLPPNSVSTLSQRSSTTQLPPTPPPASSVSKNPKDKML